MSVEGTSRACYPIRCTLLAYLTKSKPSSHTVLSDGRRGRLARGGRAGRGGTIDGFVGRVRFGVGFIFDLSLFPLFRMSLF